MSKWLWDSDFESGNTAVRIAKTFSRVLTDIATGGLAEVGNSLGHGINDGTIGDWIGSNIIDNFSGKAATDAANSATAALQEDAQAFNAEEAQKQRDFEANQAELARQWQESMSNTAYQRSVADLQAAGLNPWLAAGTSGASTGTAGIAVGSSASSAQGQAINATVNGAKMVTDAISAVAALIRAFNS